MLALAGVLYATFFVPLGPHTLYGHMSRIAADQRGARAVHGRLKGRRLVKACAIPRPLSRARCTEMSAMDLARRGAR